MPHQYRGNTEWFMLDNAAKIYPAIRNSKNSSVFRIAVVVKEIVKPDILQQALLDLRPRFPTMFVRIKHGLFWYYFEANPKNPIVRPEPAAVNQKIDSVGNNHFYFSVFYYQNRISLECFHSLCDGHSATEFVKSLTYRYFQLQGHKLSSDKLVFTVDEKPTQDEREDSFLRHVDDSGKSRGDLTPAFHIKARHFEFSDSRGVINGKLSSDQLLAVSKKHNATVSQYLVALLGYSIYLSYRVDIPKNKPIKLSVPVDMRRFLDSKSLRNFTLFFHTSFISKPNMSFDDFLAKVKNDFTKNVNLEVLQKNINANVLAEKNFFLRIAPLFIKKIALLIVGTRLGALLETATISNMGVIKLPESLTPLVESFEFYLTTSVVAGCGVGVGTYNGITNISFLRSIYDTQVEKHFFSTLAKEGAEVIIQSNFWEDNA